MKFSAVIALSIAALASAQGTGSPPKEIPAGIKCAAGCLTAVKETCKFDAGSLAGGKPPGDAAKPSSPMAGMKFRRQTGGSPPKISPQQIAAAKAARDCFCGAPALKSAQPCINTGCASAPDGGASAVKGINAICKGVASYTPLNPATPAGGAAPPA